MSAIMIVKAIGPALFSASTWTVSEFIKVMDDIEDDGAGVHDFRLAYVCIAFTSIVAGQALANYKYQKVHEDPNYQISCCFASSKLAYIMAMFKSINGGMSILHALSAIPQLSDPIDGFNIWTRLVIATALSIFQMIGQLASIMVRPDDEAHRQRWEQRFRSTCRRSFLALCIVVGNGFGTWLYDNSVFHSLQELLGPPFFDALTDLCNFISVKGDAEEVRESALYMLANYFPFELPIFGFLGLLTFFVVNQGWIEKWNKFLAPRDANNQNDYEVDMEEGQAGEFNPIRLPLQGIHTWVGYNGQLDDDGNPLERTWTRSVVTHFKGFAGGLSGAAMISRIVNDWPDVNGFSSANVILPLVAILGHDCLSWMHNFVNTNNHGLEVMTFTGTAYNARSCLVSFFSGGRYCAGNRVAQDNNGALLANQYPAGG